ncbi:2-amino-5-chloromuconate deaminase CnbZ [Roseomonas chloroacetimidivorans]|uniref:2-amino-5-chloromuconate deaminase CnbZ n=1 Tax=Roseomonas chloroacetimidivorans TaxID=1766656 RepID=UPI003C7467DE
MDELGVMEEGGYRFIRAVFQYSGGVVAQPGFRIERARFRSVLPLAQGFAAIEQHLRLLGRPMAAFCACELRSPAPFSEGGFRAFNEAYVEPLKRWGVMRDGVNPVARTNVCPEVAPPAEPGFYAFSYTMAADDAEAGGFVVAGSGEAPEGRGNYRDHAIRLGDRSPQGLREKARFVLGEMERRAAALGAGWADATGVHLYTVYDIHPFMAEELATRGAMEKGLSWHFVRPPVADLDYEMDLRGVSREYVF